MNEYEKSRNTQRFLGMYRPVSLAEIDTWAAEHNDRSEGWQDVFYASPVSTYYPQSNTGSAVYLGPALSAR